MMFISNLVFPKDDIEVSRCITEKQPACDVARLAHMTPGGDIGVWPASISASKGDICVMVCDIGSKKAVDKYVSSVCRQAGCRELKSIFLKDQCELFMRDAYVVRNYAGMVVGYARLAEDPYLAMDIGNHLYNVYEAAMTDWQPIAPGHVLYGMEPLIEVPARGGIATLSDEAASVVTNMCKLNL